MWVLGAALVSTAGTNGHGRFGFLSQYFHCESPRAKFNVLGLRDRMILWAPIIGYPPHVFVYDFCHILACSNLLMLCKCLPKLKG